MNPAVVIALLQEIFAFAPEIVQDVENLVASIKAASTAPTASTASTAPIAPIAPSIVSETAANLRTLEGK
jgi:hypothetical protein